MLQKHPESLLSNTGRAPLSECAMDGAQEFVFLTSPRVTLVQVPGEPKVTMRAVEQVRP